MTKLVTLNMGRLGRSIAVEYRIGSYLTYIRIWKRSFFGKNKFKVSKDNGFKTVTKLGLEAGVRGQLRFYN